MQSVIKSFNQSSYLNKFEHYKKKNLNIAIQSSQNYLISVFIYYYYLLSIKVHLSNKWLLKATTRDFTKYIDFIMKLL